MTDKEQIQIEGMQKIIEKMYEKTDAITTTDIINRFVKEGYHKTIWHKVADGDLPKEYKEVLFLDENYDYYIGSYADDKTFHTDIGFDMDKNKVLVWTELPEYKENENE